MRARFVVVSRVGGKNTPQMGFAKDQDVIQTVVPQRPDQALHIRVLPGRPRRCWAIPNSHRAKASRKGICIRGIIVADHEGRCRSPWERFDNLLSQPLRCWMTSHRKPE